MPIHRRSVLILVLSAIAAGVGCGRDEARPAPPMEGELAAPVAAEPAQRGTLRSVIRASGVVTPAAGTEFIATAPEPTRILEMPHAAGDRVATGDLLVRFDTSSESAEVSRQRADVARAQARLENARFTQARSRDLAERGIISRREMEDADGEVATAQAEVVRAESARAAADTSLAHAIVRAPFAGVIAQRLHDPGDLVQGIATDPILRLVDPARLEVTAQVTLADAPRILPGASARISSIATATPVRLTVAARPSAADGLAGPIVHLAFVEPTTLAVDTQVEIEIDGEERVDVVVVRADALVGQGAELAVFVAVGNKAERRAVTTGLRDAELVEITSGLRAGELVITRGQVGLSTGETISVDVTAR